MTAVLIAITTTLITASGTPSSRQAEVSPRAAFRIRLVLPMTRAPADGTPLHGYAQVINETGHPIEVRYGRCDRWLQTGLAGRHVRLEVLSVLVACASTRLAEGTTRIPVTIATTYDRCAQGKQPGTPDAPHCGGPDDDKMPALPPGTYHAELGTQHTSITPMLSEPVAVTLVPVS